MPSRILPDSIHRWPLLCGLTDEDKDCLLAGGRIRQASRGETLFRYGDPVAHLCLIVSGAVQLFRYTPDGNSRTIEILKAGQTICEEEIMGSCRGHRANALVVDHAILMEFPAAWIKETAKKHSAFALNLLSLISDQAHMAKVEAEHQASMSATQLVACFLQRLCVLHDFDPTGFDLPYSKTLIASRLGMEVETFSRTVTKLREQGITVEGKRVSIRDLRRIEQYVCAFCSIADDCPTHQAVKK